MSDTTDKNHSEHLPGQRPQFKVVSHSRLLYWWPVWSLGFVMVAISFTNGTRVAIIPEGSKVRDMTGDKRPETFELTVPGNPTESLRHAAAAPSGSEAFPNHIAPDSTLNLIYAIVLLVVILATTVTLRGLWSVINVIVVSFVALMFAVLGWWGAIIQELGQIHLYVSAAGYLFTALILCLYWVTTVFVFDQRRFILFSPGQIIVHREIGDRQAVYDTSGVTVVKRRNDFIRHRLLGLGAGDLIVSTADGRHEFELPNVLFVDSKVREIAEVMKTRPVMSD